MKNLDKLLDGGCSMLGKITPEYRKKIERYFQRPTVKNWREINGIIINWDNPFCHTIWQAWIAVDPTAPRSGEVTDYEGNIVEPWAKIPDVFTLRKALEFAIKNAGAKRANG